MKKVTALFLLLCMVLTTVAIPIGHADETGILFSDEFSADLSAWEIVSNNQSDCFVQKYASDEMLFINAVKSKDFVQAFAKKAFKNFDYTTDFVMMNSGYIGWKFRNSAKGHYLLQYGPSREFKLLKKTAQTGSTYTTIASYSVSITTEMRHSVKIKANGSKMTVYLDGIKIMEAEDKELTEGKIGVCAREGVVYFDNVVVSSGETGGDDGQQNQGSDAEYPPIVGTTTKEMFEQRVAELPKEIALKEPVEMKGGTQIFVSPTGSDEADGTKDQPYLTLQRALEKAKKGNPADTVIYMRGGAYRVNETIKINSALSGIKISAYDNEEVKLIGGYEISGNKFQTVSDAMVLERFSPSVRNKIVEVDLVSLGITDYGTIAPGGYGLDSTGTTPLPIELFFGSEKMTLSRWPNNTNTMIGVVVDEGNAPGFDNLKGEEYYNDGRGFEFKLVDERPLSWQDTGDIWMYGAYSREWALARIKVKEFNPVEKTVRTVHASHYGAVMGCNFYFMNVLEELDFPGEYFVDRENGKLYIYPLGSLEENSVTWAFYNGNMIEITDANNVVISGISLDGSKGNGIYANNVKGCTFQGLKLNNIGGHGINAMAAFNTTVLSCDLKNISGMGIYVSGDSYVLSSNGNYIQNNYLTNIGKDYDSQGIQMNGTGNVASHNSVHVLDTSALRFTGCENVIEYNEFGDVMKRVDDGGAIYTYTQFLYRGNHIRYNYLHDIYGSDSHPGMPFAIYLDNITSDNLVYGNTVIDTVTPIHHTWGREVAVVNNIFAGYGRSNIPNASMNESEITSLSYFDTPQQEPNRPFTESGEPNGVFKSNASGLPWQSEEWGARYPRLPGIADDEWWIAKHCYYADNVIYDHLPPRITENRIQYGEVINTKLLTEDPFIDYEGGNYNLNLDAPVLAGYTGLETVPSYEKSGIVMDGTFRTEKPKIGKFYLTYPENHSSGNDLKNITLRWTRPDGADYFDIEVATDPDMKHIVLSERTENITHTINVDGYGQKYYWRVTAGTRMNTMNPTPSVSEIGSFSTKEAKIEFEELAISAQEILKKYSTEESGYSYPKKVQEKLSAEIITAREMANANGYEAAIEYLDSAIRTFLKSPEMTLVVEDTFENDALGAEPEGYTMSGRGKFAVESIGGGKSLQILDDILDNYAVLPKSFDPISGKMSISFRVKPMQENCNMFMKIRQDSLVDPVVVQLAETGEILLCNGFDAGGEHLTNYQAGEWYQFNIEIDTVACIYSVDINGTNYVKDKLFYDKFIENFKNKNYLNAMVITTGAPMENLGTFYFDDLR
ncbi:MAG: right-handed parallel beta-helix repeat-containing protein, partial [Clostridia bacterium]|nr:right-handed parallel beta-helix repeat-containing protein [Clostridia bacterium]